MLNPLTSVVVYLTEMLISYIFLSNVSEKRFPSGRCLAIGIAATFLTISNSCDAQPKTSGTHLVTSKGTKSAHGFGLKSVRKALRKYNGDYEWMYDAERCMFVVTAMIGSHSNSLCS